MKKIKSHGYRTFIPISNKVQLKNAEKQTHKLS